MAWQSLKSSPCWLAEAWDVSQQLCAGGSDSRAQEWSRSDGEGQHSLNVQGS